MNVFLFLTKYMCFVFVFFVSIYANGIFNVSIGNMLGLIACLILFFS